MEVERLKYQKVISREEYGRTVEFLDGSESIVYRKYWLKKDKLVIERLLTDIGIGGIYKLIEKLIDEDNIVRGKFDLKYSVGFREDFKRICIEYGWDNIVKYNERFKKSRKKKRKYIKKNKEYIEKMRDEGFESNR